jgi:hypothetical protein
MEFSVWRVPDPQRGLATFSTQNNVAHSALLRRSNLHISILAIQIFQSKMMDGINANPSKSKKL